MEAARSEGQVIDEPGDRKITEEPRAGKVDEPIDGKMTEEPSALKVEEPIDGSMTGDPRDGKTTDLHGAASASESAKDGEATAATPSSSTPAADGGADGGNVNEEEKFEDVTNEELPVVTDAEGLERQRAWEAAQNEATAEAQMLAEEEARRKGEEAVVQMDGYREGRIKWRAELARQMQAWRNDPEWDDEVAQLVVTTPKGTFCQLDCHVTLALPPDAVYNTLCDPYNRRVFKNIKAVKHRKVLSDDGDRQEVEVEQSAAWRFLVFSGSFDTRLLVTQDRAERTMSFRIAQPGFMRRFEGSWRVDPLPVASSKGLKERKGREGDGVAETKEEGKGKEEGQGSGSEEKQDGDGKGGENKTAAGEGEFTDAQEVFDGRGGGEGAEGGGAGERSAGQEGMRMASRVHLRQVVQLALSPPPPLDYYVRGITAQVVRDMLKDFQSEAARIRYGGDEAEEGGEEKKGQEGAGGRAARMSASFLHREALGGKKGGKGKGCGRGKGNGVR